MLTFTNVAVTTAIVIGVGWLFLWMRRTGATADHSFRDRLLYDAADWLAPRLNLPRPRVSAALLEILNQRATSDTPLLEPVKRIEYEIAKLSPTQCRRTVVVALQQGETVIVGKIALDVGWEDLPRELRDEFIRSGKDTQTYLVLDRPFVQTVS